MIVKEKHFYPDNTKNPMEIRENMPNLYEWIGAAPIDAEIKERVHPIYEEILEMRELDEIMDIRNYILTNMKQLVIQNQIL